MRFFNRRPASAATRHHGFHDRALLRQVAAAATATAAATTCDFQTAGLPAQLQVQQQQHRSSSSCHVFHGKPAIHSSRSCNTRRSSSCHRNFCCRLPPAARRRLQACCRPPPAAGAFKPAAGCRRLLMPAPSAGISSRRRTDRDQRWRVVRFNSRRRTDCTDRATSSGRVVRFKNTRGWRGATTRQMKCYL